MGYRLVNMTWMDQINPQLQSNYPNKTMGCTQYEFSTDNRFSRSVGIAYKLCKFLYNKCNHNYQSVYLVIYRF